LEPITVKQLLEAGAHFGHQTSRWHPKMKRYIFTQRNGIHIIDLEQTTVLLDKACSWVRELVAGGKNILFVGTKKQAQEAVAEEAKRCGMPYVNLRWLGGMLTNFPTIQGRIDFLVRQEDKQSRGEFDSLPKKEKRKIDEDIARLNRQMSGFKEMTTIPGALFVVDITVEKIALAEARKMGVPIVAMADTNCDPDLIDIPIPSNDDAIKAIKLMCGRIADAVLEGKAAAESGKPAAAAEETAAPATAMAAETKVETGAADTSKSYSFTPDQ
jgi:small subunit ribosomal protein S2